MHLTTPTGSPAPFDPSAELLRLSLEAAPVGIAMFDREMRYIATSRRYRLDMGDVSRSLIGKLHYDVFPGTLRYAAIHRRCLAGATEQCAEDRFVLADGSEKFTKWDCRPWRLAGGSIGGLVLFVQDITAEVLRQREARIWEDAIEHANFGITIVDGKDTTAHYVNPAFARMFGTTPEQMKGTALLLLNPPEQRARVAEKLAMADAKGSAVFDTMRVRADGSVFAALISVTSLKHEDGSVASRIGTMLDITERKREQEAARAIDARFRMYIDNSPAAVIVIDPAGVIVESNGGAHAMFATGGQSLCGRTIEDLHRRDNLAAVRQDCALLHCQGRLQREYRMLRQDGAEVWVVMSAVVLNGGNVLTFLQDITSLRQAEAARAAAEADLHTAVQLGPGVLYRARMAADGLHIVSIHGDVARLMYAGASGGDADIAAMLHAPESVALLHRIGSAGGALSGSADLPVTGADGGQHWVRNTARAMQRDHGCAEISGYLSEVTREKNEQQRLQQINTLITLGEMATGIAHELKQPLSSISFAAQNATFLLEHKPDDQRAVGGKLDKIIAEARRAARLIEHMQVFARNERQSFQPLSWHTALAGALEILEPRLREVSLRNRLPADLPAVTGTAILMEQVLINLIGNALDAYAAHPAGPGVRTITLSGETAGGAVVLRVADQAGGIPPHMLARVFEPFFSTKAPGHGTGLGLAVCFGTVMEMGGTLTAHNADGGAVFEIRLPPAESAAAQPPSADG